MVLQNTKVCCLRSDSAVSSVTSSSFESREFKSENRRIFFFLLLLEFDFLTVIDCHSLIEKQKNNLKIIFFFFLKDNQCSLKRQIQDFLES